MSFNDSPNLLIIPVIATAIYCVSKFAEMKFIDKEFKPVKTLFRDALIVFISSLTATYIFFHFKDSIQEFMNVITNTKVSSIGGALGGISAASSPAEIFTDNPNF